jgi:excisionase family DNA binding protein
VSALVKRPEPVIIEVPGDPERFMKLVARGMLLAFHQGIQEFMGSRVNPPAVTEPQEVMTADEVAEFLGVDLNTVYDYAGRGVIPHQRLGKRILFRRGTLLSWLEGCRATSTRKG